MNNSASSHPLQVFISYAHEDASEMAELVKHLGMMKRDGLIALWVDRDITGGREWKGEIAEHLESADLILLLISVDFINSDYCWDVEMSRAMERHNAKEARVVPVIVKPAEGWERARFAKLQALPQWGRAVTDSAIWRSREEAWVSVAKGLRRVVEELRA